MLHVTLCMHSDLGLLFAYTLSFVNVLNFLFLDCLLC